MTTSRDAILEALRTRSLPEGGDCEFETDGRGGGWDCIWPSWDDPDKFVGHGATPTQAHSAMCEKIEHALKEQR